MAQGSYYRGKNIWGMIKNWWENDVICIVGSGAPVDGVVGTGTGAGLCGPGSQYTDIAVGQLYINAGTKASPAWKLFTHAAVAGDTLVTTSLASTAMAAKKEEAVKSEIKKDIFRADETKELKDLGKK